MPWELDSNHELDEGKERVEVHLGLGGHPVWKTRNFLSRPNSKGFEIVYGRKVEKQWKYLKSRNCVR